MLHHDKNDSVRFDELQSLIRLALELRQIPRGSEPQKRAVLAGLCALVDARVGLWVEVDGLATGRIALREVVHLGWPDPSDEAVLRGFAENEPWRTLDMSMAPAARAMTSPIVTFTLEQLVDAEAWCGSEHVQRFRRAALVESFIYSTFAPGGDAAVALSLHRAEGARPFNERDRRIVDAFHRACAFLHEPPSDLDPGLIGDLGPRLRDTLRGLVRGLSEKRIAAELGLSPHTVHDYVKALHRHFGVSSRSELLAHCLSGR